MKKIISFIFILILTVCFSSVVFGFTGITSTDELECFLSYYGYDIDFESANYVGTTFSSFNTYHVKKNYYTYINKNCGGFYSTRSNLTDDVLSSADIFIWSQSNATGKFGFMPGITGVNNDEFFYDLNQGRGLFLVDIDTNTITYCSQAYLRNDDFYLGKIDEIPSEMTSFDYQKQLLINSGLIYSELNVYGSDILNNGGYFVIFEHQGGGLVNNIVDDVNYQGKLNYNPATEVCNITYTKGFSSGVTYDLFLEQYKLSNASEYGLPYYPTDTINLFSLDTSYTTVGISASKFMDSIHYAYRLCLGKNSFLEKGSNDVYICTDWLIPLKLSVNGANTITSYQSFSTFHYMDFLGLDYYNPDDWHGDSDIENPSGDTGNIGGTTLDPYFLNAPSGLIETDLGFKVDVISNINLDVSNYYLAFTQYSSDFTPEFSQMIRDNILWQNKENSQYSINLKDFYDFSGDKYFKVFLIKTSSGIIDSSDYFYTDSALIIPDDFDSNDKDEEEIKGGIAGIWQAITNLPKLIGDAIAGIFIPADGFFSDYFSELNDWFSERLGILYFPFDFIVDFFSRIYTSEFKDPTIVIPAMQIPLFEEYGNIYDGTTFNFKEFINQHETFMYIYNLYLIAVDGIVIFGLIRLLMKKYEEVTTNGN